MKTFLFVVTTAVLAAALPCILPAQNNTADQPLVDFAGTWRGICQDGNPFVILSIKVSGGALAGDITIANMQGGNGQCATVIDPPSPDHAMKIDGARVRVRNLEALDGTPIVDVKPVLSGDIDER